MAATRTTDLILMAISIAMLLGTVSGTLPAEALLPALAFFAVGALELIRSHSDRLISERYGPHAPSHPPRDDRRSAMPRTPARELGASSISQLEDTHDAPAERPRRLEVEIGSPMAEPPWRLDAGRSDSRTNFTSENSVSSRHDRRRDDSIAGHRQAD